jgi:hypothetical protein
MPGKLKWDISGKGVKPKQPGEGGGNNYEGPNLVKGSYPAKIKRMEVTKITSNTVNKGKPRIRILLEVQTDKIKGKEQYHGAPVWDGLNIIESGKPYVNAFLHALTDGSEKSKRAIEAVFWDEDKGADFKKVRNKKSDEIEVHITKIGRLQINSPNGEKMIQIVTRPGEDNKGNFRPEVAEYLPYTGAGVDDDDSDIDEMDDDDDDMLGAVDDDDDEDDDEDEGDPEEYDDDDDDDSDEDDEDDDEDDEDEEPEPAAPVKKTTRGRAKKPF